jgi:hypothetical protein
MLNYVNLSVWFSTQMHTFNLFWLNTFVLDIQKHVYYIEVKYIFFLQFKWNDISKIHMQSAWYLGNEPLNNFYCNLKKLLSNVVKDCCITLLMFYDYRQTVTSWLYLNYEWSILFCIRRSITYILMKRIFADWK